jgi:hypothetical protein
LAICHYIGISPNVMIAAVKGTVNLHLRLIKHSTVKTFREVEVSIQAFLTSSMPPRRPGFKPGSGHVGFCDRHKWRWGRFSPRTSVSPAK